MGRVKFIFFCSVLFLLTAFAEAGTYTLLDGKTLSGDPVSYDKSGVIIKMAGGAYSPRTAWSKFSQESLNQFVAEAKSPKDAALIQPFLEETIQEEQKIRTPIEPKLPPKVERPTGSTGFFTMFTSLLGWFIFLVIYAANLFAGYEIAIYRRQPVGLVVGVSAAAPFIGPLVFLCMPPRKGMVIEEAAPTEAATVAIPSTPPEKSASPLATPPPSRPTTPAAPRAAFKLTTQSLVPQAQAPQASEEAQAPEVPAAPPAALPATVTFQRTDFTFNRRFFETKMPGFFRVVQSEAEKDMVLYIKAARGEFLGKRISKISQTELHLQTFKDDATADEMIPFTEIQEVQIRHKDMV